ncbi:MAG: IspD/TarI family cytidylyltransferase [Bacilli bacterium]|jgi:2-C-methyl-D-erythritol 4-phosphate cytidylyltransferase
MTYGIILLGGDSLRTSTSLPKQFFVINGKEVFLYSFELFLKNPNINKIILVSNQDYVDYVKIKVSTYKTEKEIDVIKGGFNRQESSFLALNYIKMHESDTKNLRVIIHDSARPLLTTKVLNDIVSSLDKMDAVTTYYPIYDSLCTSNDMKTIDGYRARTETFSIQTPQGFKFDLIYKAHLSAINKKITNINDDSVLVKKINHSVGLVLGDPMNFKITTFEDLYIVKKIIEG